MIFRLFIIASDTDLAEAARGDGLEELEVVDARLAEDHFASADRWGGVCVRRRRLAQRWVIAL